MIASLNCSPVFTLKIIESNECKALKLKNYFHFPRKRVSLVPLVDVVFILLLFFMLTTSIAKEKQLPVGYSSATTDSPEAITRELVIETEDGVISADGQRISTLDRRELSAWVGSDTEAIYVVDTLSQISTQTLVSVLDRLSQAGATQLMVKEDQEDQP